MNLKMSLALIMFGLLSQSSFAKIKESYSGHRPLTLEEKKELCYNNTIGKYREVSLIQAGDGSGMGYDFSKTKSLIVDSRVNVQYKLDNGTDAVLACFYEKSTIHFEAATSQSLGKILVNVDSKKFSESEQFDAKLQDMQKEGPYEWSSSKYYTDLLIKVFAPITASEIVNLPIEIKTSYKVIFEVNDKSIPTIISNPYELTMLGEEVYVHYADAGDHLTPYMTLFTHEGLRGLMKNLYDSSAVLCNKLTKEKFESELVKLGMLNMIETYYDRQCPEQK